MPAPTVTPKDGKRVRAEALWERRGEGSRGGTAMEQEREHWLGKKPTRNTQKVKT